MRTILQRKRLSREEQKRGGESAMSVGIRELKDNLSRYLKQVKAGERLAVTERGEIIAFLVPAKRSAEYERMLSLIREGKGTWKGGKPAGAKNRLKVGGKPVSEIVLEDRR
jgi:prevent-host-death family protein